MVHFLCEKCSSSHIKKVISFKNHEYYYTINLLPVKFSCIRLILQGLVGKTLKSEDLLRQIPGNFDLLIWL